MFELRLDVVEVTDDPWVAAIGRRDRAGSYHELDRLLDRLLRVDLSVWRSTVALEGAGFEEGVSWLAVRMPDPIRVPAWVVWNHRELAHRRTRARGKGQALDVRDREIRRLVADGRPLQWVAAEYGLSVSQVYRVLGCARAA